MNIWKEMLKDYVLPSQLTAVEFHVIRKTSKGYSVVSKTGKSLGGPYKTRGQAVKRLGQVEYFKRRGK